jgi:hypothetical protein
MQVRVNIYWEELSDEPPEVIERTAGSNNMPFWGLRIWLRSPLVLRKTEDDDDRSAVTFWFESHAALNDFVERLYRRKHHER